MIEQYFNYADSAVKEMTDIFEIRVENLEPKKIRKNLLQLPRNSGTKKSIRKRKEQTLTPL